MTPNEKKLLPAQIALFTDFGEAGLYTGQMEAELLSHGLPIPVIRLLSDAPKYNPRASAYLLEALSQYLPQKTLFLSVIDPGVGSARFPLLVQTEHHWFVGPDNGLFSQVLRRSPNASVNIVSWRPDKLSASFHGRDLFAPAAAAISVGRDIPLSPIEPAGLIGSAWPDCLAEIIYVDHFGNAFTGIRADTLADDALLSVGGATIGNARIFGELDRGQPFWYCNSIGLVEIAVNQGRADQLLALEIGRPISVTSL